MIQATLIDHMGSDLSVVNAARVSFGKKSDWDHTPCPDLPNMPPEIVSEDKKLTQKDTKLIRYLAKHNHISPFGHCFVSWHIKAPIFVARQLVKHSYLRWNEVSRRYVDDEPEFYVPDVWRGRSEDKKQGSEGVVAVQGMDVGRLYGNPDYVSSEVCLRAYKFLLEQGVAPEQARMVLPTSQLTEWIWSGSLDAFARMCRLRCASDTQYESRIVADQISEVMRDLFPVSWTALLQTGEE
jgi:thymidylate synthase (FAD)